VRHRHLLLLATELSHQVLSHNQGSGTPDLWRPPYYSSRRGLNGAGRWAIPSGDELRRLMHRPSTCGGPRRAAVPGVNASAGGCGSRPPALQWLARWYAAPPGWRCGRCRRSLSSPSRRRRRGCWLPCRRARPTGSAGSTGRGDAALARQSADGCHDLVGQGAVSLGVSTGEQCSVCAVFGVSATAISVSYCSTGLCGWIHLTGIFQAWLGACGARPPRKTVCPGTHTATCDVTPPRRGVRRRVVGARWFAESLRSYASARRAGQRGWGVFG